MSRAGRIAGVAARRSLAAARGAGYGFRSAQERRRATAVEVRRGLEELGPAFIKLGQLVSVRPDIFPAELALELTRLQDSVPPVAAETIAAAVERDFGRSLEELFASFEPVPLASASIAQVHRATLRSDYRPAWGEVLPAGCPLAVKVVRPGIAEEAGADLELARRGVSFLQRLGLLRRWNLAGHVEELSASLRSELDLRREARVGLRFAFDFRDDPVVCVPRVVWPLTSRRVLTSEYVQGWPLSRLPEAVAAGVDARRLAEHGARVFMLQVLVHGRFHADLHPANLLLTRDNRIVYLDFGIVGRLSSEERFAVAQILGALAFRDPERALRYSSALGLRVPAAIWSRLVPEVEMLMEQTMSGPADLRGFGVGLLRLLARHRVTIPTGYALLVKSLVTVEGVARTLYPDIDIIRTARPFVTRLLLPSLLLHALR